MEKNPYIFDPKKHNPTPRQPTPAEVWKQLLERLTRR